ncbi:MAG: SUMF1/EgtB/PvdO family nonheme iron enzyme [Acidobacteria bacterium]|nr:SUMF1/EgtB/PvdO family nonheme iron enzyme [Acidobacteriota bacterium]
MSKQCPVCSATYPDNSTFCPADGTPLIEAPDQSDPFIGKVLEGKYLIVSRIGAGGMGNVYRGRHTKMETNVAIKILHASMVSDAKAVERFRREARAALAVNHPNAIQVMDFGVTEDQTVFIVMELLDGTSLQKILETEKIIPVEKTVKIFKQICAAVSAAHLKDVIHRDLKPDNVIVLNYNQPTEQVKVLDFSIAKVSSGDKNAQALTEIGLVVGTPQYMSPEQAQGIELDKRADIYSLGVCLYQLLTGALPFTAASSMALALKHIHALPRPVREVNNKIPLEIETVVMKAMAKRPNDRQQTADELSDELEKALAASGRSATTSSASGLAASTNSGQNPITSSNLISSTNTPRPIPTPRQTSHSLKLNQPQPSYVESTKEKKGYGVLITVAIVIVVLLGGGGAGAYWYLYIKGSGSKNGSPPSDSPERMTWIKGNTFKMGKSPETASKDELNQTPVNPIAVDDFWLGNYEVSNKEYKKFIDETKYAPPPDWQDGSFPPGTDDLPVVNVTWIDANAYCSWLSGKLGGRKARLPNEAEWEYAARGTDERPYPWGKTWAANRTVSGDSQVKGEAVPVTSASLEQDQSPFRIFAMAGNVAEWTYSDYSIYPNSKAPVEDKFKGNKIIRGGHFKSTKEAITTTFRSWSPVDFKDPKVGFRVLAESTPEDRKKNDKDSKLEDAP